MSKTRVLAGIVSVVVLLTVASSVRADPVHLPPGLEKFNLVEAQTLDLSELGKDAIRALLSEHFANNNGNHFGFRNLFTDQVAGNNGKHVGSTGLANPFANNNGRHLGFSVAATRPGNRIGILNPSRFDTSASDSKSPEPTGMLLLGTGLAAGAAFLRRRARKRRRTSEG